MAYKNTYDMSSIYYFRKSSDYSEDAKSIRKDYDMTHSQTTGGIRAYARGEQPLSYWTKAELKRAFRKCIDNLPDAEAQKFKGFLSRINHTPETFIKKLFTRELDELQLILLELSGLHYTGRYYRHTQFYRVSPNIRNILTAIQKRDNFNKVAPPKIQSKQLRLDIEIPSNNTFYNH